jgi:ADP-ribosylglycohydrolase
MSLYHPRALGCLAGLALGDALGMATEFLSPEQIADAYGWVSSLVTSPGDHPHHRLIPGTVTDDTGQALAIARAYALDGRLTPEAVGESLLKWAASLSAEEFAVLTGPSTRQALENLKNGMDVQHSGRQGVTNGAAMRAAPAGLVNAGDVEGALQDAVTASLPTHNTNVAIAGAAAVACAVSEAALEGSTLASILQAGMSGAERGATFGAWRWGTPLAGRIELAERLVQGAGDDRQALQDLYRYVGVGIDPAESVAAAFGVFLLAEGDPMRAVILGANIGGDTDTIAAIAGAISGAWMGIEALEPGLVRRVDELNALHLSDIADRLEQAAAAREAVRRN